MPFGATLRGLLLSENPNPVVTLVLLLPSDCSWWAWEICSWSVSTDHGSNQVLGEIVAEPTSARRSSTLGGSAGSSTRPLHQSASMRETALTEHSFASSPCPGIVTHMCLGKVTYFKFVCFHHHMMQSYVNSFYFGNLVIDVLKINSSHYNHKIPPSPVGFLPSSSLRL